MSVSRNLKLFAGFAVVAALLAGCGGGDDSESLELRPVVSGTSSSVGYNQNVTPSPNINGYQTPNYNTVVNQVGEGANNYAVLDNNGNFTNPTQEGQNGICLISASNFFVGGAVGAIEDPSADVYLITQADAYAPTTLAAKLDGRSVTYKPIITISNIANAKIALRPGYYVLSMRNVPFYPGLSAQRGQVVFKVNSTATIVSGPTTFPTKVTMALPAYGQVMDHTSYIKIETYAAAGATKAGFYMKHANGISMPSEKGFTNGASVVYGVDGGPTLGNPITLITSWSL